MPFPSSYVLPDAELSSLVLRDVENRSLQADIMSLLVRIGLHPQIADDLIVLTEVGGVHGNKSVTLILDLVEFDGRGTLLLQAFLGEAPAGAQYSASTVAGVIASSVMFGGIQVRKPQNGPEQVWLVVPMMQSDLSSAALLDAIVLLADEADFLDDIITMTWK